MLPPCKQPAPFCLLYSFKAIAGFRTHLSQLPTIPSGATHQKEALKTRVPWGATMFTSATRHKRWKLNTVVALAIIIIIIIFDSFSVLGTVLSPLQTAAHKSIPNLHMVYNPATSKLPVRKQKRLCQGSSDSEGKTGLCTVLGHQAQAADSR